MDCERAKGRCAQRRSANRHLPPSRIAARGAVRLAAGAIAGGPTRQGRRRVAANGGAGGWPVAFWLMKTEPSVFSYGDLEGRTREPWDGVRNAAAALHLRAMRPGDLALVYHTGGERQAVGMAEVVSAPYPDPTAEDPRWVAVDVRPLRRLQRPVTLAQMRADPAFAGWVLLRQGRLSVVPVPGALWARILELGGTAGPV